jgi:ribosomal-protein-alanine N-acetyltransferase
MNTTLDRLAPLRFSPMDEAAARSISSWRYEAPYEVYSMDREDVDQLVSAFIRPEYAYHAILDRAGELAGYCCFGADAQVPGGDYDDPALDVGLGVRPDLTGQGLGATFVSAVLNFARQEMTPTELRITVAEFNKRALRVWQKAGFQPVQKFERTFDGMPFVILTMGAGHRHPQQSGAAE